MLRPWNLNRIRRSTRCGRNMVWRFGTGTTSRSPAGWRRRWASWRAARGGSRIRSSAPTASPRSSRTTGKSGSSGWPRRRRPTRNRPAAARRFCRCSRETCASPASSASIATKRSCRSMKSPPGCAPKSRRGRGNTKWSTPLRTGTTTSAGTREIMTRPTRTRRSRRNS